MGVFADEGIRVVRRATVTAVRSDQSTGDVIAEADTARGREEFRATRILTATGRRLQRCRARGRLPSPSPGRVHRTVSGGSGDDR